MAHKYLQIAQDSSLTCNQKLDKIQNLVRSTNSTPAASIYFISDVFEDCINQEHTKCLETAYFIAENVSLIADNDLKRGLKSIGQADIDAVNQFIKQKIQRQNRRSTYYLSKLVPLLYRGQENEMASQMQDWYQTYSYFLFRALENTLIAFLMESSGHGATDFSNELDPIKDKLEDIAQTHGLDPDNAYQDKNYEVVKVFILLTDLEWDTKNTVNWNNIQSNLSQYLQLEAFLTYNGSPLSDLKQQNTHPLTKLLILDYSDKLTYYDHCLELIQPGRGQNSDPNVRIKNDLLARDEYESTIAEIEVFNVLRREFGVNSVTIEQQAPNGGVPDAEITTGGETIWTEITLPRPQLSYEIARQYSAPMNPEESGARTTVTNKLRKQIRDVKKATGDRTMLVIKNEESKVGNEIVEDYVEGFTGLGIPEDDPDADPILLTADSGLQYDSVPDHLDILVNFDTLNDLSNPPYIEGQVANLTDVDQNIINQLANAFNAEEFTPP